MSRGRNLSSLLRDGLEYESSGQKEKAAQCYDESILILRDEMKRSDLIQQEVLKRQIRSLESAIQKMNLPGKGKVVEEGPKDEASAILQELGLSVSQGEGPALNEVVGMDDLKKELFTKIIYPLKFPDLAREFNINPGGGLLLYGPPGNGKTFIVRALAREVSMNFIYVNPSSLFSQWFGNFEKNISSLFRAAKMLSPSILFFDELDSLFPSRDQSTSDASRRGVSQFLNEMGGFREDPSKPVLILGATNVPWQLDPAVTRPGRFDRLIYIPPPDSRSRAEIVRQYMSRVSRKGEIDFEKIGEMTQGYSAADMEYLCKYSSQKAFMKSVEGKGDEMVTMDTFIESLEVVKPSVNRNVIERYRRFEEQRKE
ncbi:MAG: ATP-binding protein [Candidatus Thermoplasmatota archaeon]|nr:ATP-binding protein [Candidatus Thermoplasmatota archaeon]MCL5790550.1 ATP-binding protein [Candidatus Thermoplasmatota archaeon]